MNAAYEARAGNFTRDPRFHLALLAGPVCWLVIYLWLQPELQLAWPLYSPLLFAMPVIVYPVVEEIIFRGLIQDLVYRYLSSATIGPVTLANILTSVLFTGLHFIYHPPLWAALVFFPSLVFGFFRDSTGGIAAPILLHVFYNAGFIWLFSVPA